MECKMESVKFYKCIFLAFFLVLITYPFSSNAISVTKVGIHQYKINGTLSSTELVWRPYKGSDAGLLVSYHTKYWGGAVDFFVKTVCPKDKNAALQKINEYLGSHILENGNRYNEKNSHVTLYCTIEGDGEWTADINVPTPDNTPGKGCQVTTPSVMDFGTVKQGSKMGPIKREMMYINCDNDATLNFYFKSTEKPGVLTMDGTVIKYGYADANDDRIRPEVSKVVYSGRGDALVLTARLIDAGNVFGPKIGYILMVVDIL